MYKAWALIALVCSTGVFSAPAGLPLVGDLTGNLPIVGGILGGGAVTDIIPNVNSNGDGNILSILQILPLKEGLNGLVGDIVNLLRLLLSQVRLLVNALIPSLSTEQVSELEALLSNPNMTSSEILQKLDQWINDQDDIDLVEFYKSAKTDIQGKVDAVLNTLERIVGSLLPQVRPLIAQLRKVVNDKVLPLLDQDQAIGNLLTQILKPIQQILDPFLNGLNLLNFGNLLDINNGLLGALGNLLENVLTTVANLLNGVLGGNGSDGLLGGVLGDNGLLGGVLGDNGLLGGVLGGNGLLGGLTGGKKSSA